MTTSAQTVTILFTDLIRSTELSERLGAEGALEMRRTHFRLLRDAVAAHGGQEVKNLGDGLMVVFQCARTFMRGRSFKRTGTMSNRGRRVSGVRGLYE